MSKNLNKKEIEKFSRQIILKNIGAAGQKKILSSKVLIVGMGGLGCPVAEFLTRSGIGTLGIADHDTVSLSNIHRQGLYNEKDINQSKVKIAKKKLNKKLISNLSKKFFLKGINKALIIHHAKESLYLSRDEVIHTNSQTINKRKIINSVGAGDAFCAAFIYGIHESWDIKKTLKKAHAAGSTMMKVDSSSGNLPNIQKL